MKITEMREQLEEIISHVTFTYNGNSCGIDPFSINEFNMWYGEKSEYIDSIENVFNVPFFDGKTLIEIYHLLQNIE